jgi:ABC-2 type transport system permease protein
MNDFFTVLRKELLESVCDAHSLSGLALQGLTIILAAGVFLPAIRPGYFVEAGKAMGVFFVFSSVVSASLAADSFAGERERKTLETLLSTPISELALRYGKAAHAVCHAMLVSVAVLSCSALTALVRNQPGHACWPFLLGSLATTLAASIDTAALTFAISSRAATARAARQMTMLITLGAAAIAAGLLRSIAASPGWTRLFLIDAGLITAGLCALLFAGRSLRGRGAR